jgi:hypothetical protein
MTVKADSDGLLPEEIIKRIERALVLGGGTHSWEDIRIGLIEGRYQIFWNKHGACITEICDAPQARYLNCFVVAGELPGVMELHEEVENHAISMGCKYMQTSARMGWQKVLPNYGWKKARIVFVRDLQEMNHG